MSDVDLEELVAHTNTNLLFTVVEVEGSPRENELNEADASVLESSSPVEVSSSRLQPRLCRSRGLCNRGKARQKMAAWTANVHLHSPCINILYLARATVSRQ